MVSSFKNYCLSLLVAVGFQTISAQTVENLFFNSTNQIGVIDYTAGTTPTTVPVSTTPDVEAISHAEDATGAVQFYVTGNGFYNAATNAQMPGTFGMLGNESVTEVNVCQVPGNVNQYYVIYSETTGCSDVYFSIVDMSLPGGPDVVFVDSLLVAGDYAEGKELVRKPGSPELWLVLYDCDWGFKTMDVTQTGITSLQGLKAYNPAITEVSKEGRGELDFHNQLLGYSHMGADKLYIGEFDPCTRSMTTLDDPTVADPYGMEFSYTGQYAYASLYTALPNNNNLFQYRLSDAATLMHNVGIENCAGDSILTANGLGQIELAPNEKLYIAGNSPGSAGACNIIEVDFASSFSPQFSNISLNGIGRGISDIVQSDAFVSQLTIIVDKQDVTCYGGTDGTIDIDIQGGVPPFEIKWDGLVSTDVSRDNLIPGFYQLEVTDAGCLNSSFFQMVHISEPDSISYALEAEVAQCYDSGSLISLNISGGTPPYSVDWFGINPNSAPIGDWNLIISDDNGCTEIVDYTVEGPERITWEDTVIEINCYNGLAEVQISNIAGGVPPYLINGDNKTTLFFTAGVHNVEIVDDNGCIESKTFVFTQPDEIILDYTLTQESCNILAATVEATASGGTGDLLVEFLGTNPDNVKPGNFYIRATDENGCEVLELVEFLPEETSVFMPNVFSPNGDGQNDYFFPVMDCFQTMDIVIYDRWGKMVFETEDGTSLGWDGTVDGEIVPQDVYIYELNYITSRGFEEQIQGTVTVLY